MRLCSTVESVGVGIITVCTEKTPRAVRSRVPATV